MESQVVRLSASRVVLSDGTSRLRCVSLDSSSEILFEEVFDPPEQIPTKSVVVYAMSDRASEDAFWSTLPSVEYSESIEVPDHLPAPGAPTNLMDFPRPTEPFIISAASGSLHLPSWIVSTVHRRRVRRDRARR
jgi:hypothetical protein